jgi:hypothetical protein
MTKREKKIMEIAVEIDRLLTDGIEIHPNSPIHEKLNQALLQPAVLSSKPKGKSSKKVVDPEQFSKWCEIIKRI